MAILPLPLPPGVQARALLHHILEHGDMLGEDATGRTIVQLALDDWVLDELMGFDADATELEDGGDAEPEADDEQDWLPVVLLDWCGRRSSGPAGLWRSVQWIEPWHAGQPFSLRFVQSIPLHSRTLSA